jgi:hypothetical protein
MTSAGPTPSPDHSRTVNIAFPLSLRYFLLAILSLTIVCLGCSFIARQAGLGLPYSFPYAFYPGLFFSDYYELLRPIRYFGTPAFFHQQIYFMYPPAMSLPYVLFNWTSHSGKTFALFLLAAGAFLSICFYRILRRHGLGMYPAFLLVAGTALTSYPYLLVLQRWNMEIVSWLPITIGLWSFYRGHYRVAAVCFGAATALKIYPFIFFGLFPPRGRFKEILLGLLTAAAITLIALRAMSPDVLYAFHWSGIQLQAFGQFYAASTMGLTLDHSFFAIVKCVTLPWHPDLMPLIRPYTWIEAIVCLVLYFTRIWKLPVVNQILILSILSITIPPVSFDYTLLSLYASLAILCVLALRGSPDQQIRLMPYFLLYALLLTPETYAMINGIRFGGPLRALCLLALLLLSFKKEAALEQEPC